ncbi:amino acid adenylation domain-containing protein [Streptomyces sp. NPDC048448]|uniref:non-ribosomal peptide synthetase/MFS transporter n=1 Tax=Streptomyces sp. NPDC048448 TaxID=3365554 RepID=UPI003722A371
MTASTVHSTNDPQERLRARLASRAGGVKRPVAAGDGPVPLSGAQARIWFESEFQPDSPAYNVPTLLRMRGGVDREALLDAVRDLVERHQVLRCVVNQDGEQPTMVPQSAGAVPIEVVELADGTGEELDRRIRERSGRPFALATECPLRVTYFDLGAERHALLLVLHHIATDARSNVLLVEDLAALYTARLTATPPPPPPTQYAQVVQADPGPRFDDGLDWWAEQLRGSSGALDLPTDRPRPPVPDNHGATVPVAIPEDLLLRLRALATAAGCSPFMVLTGVWQALLGRITGSADISVGVPEAGRHRPGSEGAVGCFINTIVLRTDLGGDPTGRELLDRLRVTTLDALDHGDVPFDRLVDRLRPARGTEPLFATMINLFTRPDVTDLFPGLDTEYVQVGTGAVKLDLALHLFDERDRPGLGGALEYRTALFDPETAARLIDWYVSLLAGLVDRPDEPVGAVPLADPQSGIVRGPHRDYPLSRPVPALIEEWAHRTPDEPAVTAPGGTLTYGELDRRANRLAHRLLAEGVRPDDLVAVLADRELELAVGLLGTLKAGAAFVPLEPSYPDDRLAQTLTAAGTRVVLVQRSFAQRVRADVVIVIDDVYVDPELPDARPPVQVEPDHLAYVIFTSGSTGTPKGVAVEHRSLAHYLHAVLERIDGAGRSFALLSTAAADLGFVSLFGSLISGGRLHLVDREVATDPARLADYFTTWPVDVVKMVPSHLELLAAHGELAAVLPRRTLILAGEACPWELADRIRAARPELTVHNHYGPTETTVSVLGCDVAEAAGSAGGSTVVPLGLPFPNAVCYVVDPAGRLLPPLVTGELLISGPGVARGYLNQPDLTARSFVLDPISGSDRCYRTGDRVRVRSDGLIEFLGRLDDQVKVRGYRVELGEVTAACRAIPGVRDAVVLAVGAAHQRRLAAWLVPDGAATLDPGTVRAALRGTMPEHMVPAVIVSVPEFPLTANGKVDRKALPVPDAEPQSVARVLPETATQRRIADVWRDVLQFGDTPIGIDEDFFSLGGDSFQALRASREIDPDLRVIDLFTRPTVRDLAMFLDTRTGAEPDDRLLQLLATSSAGRTAELTVLCFPYAGGSAAAFQPLAAELTARRTGVEVLGVELPGHDAARPDEAMIDISELIRRCQAELADRESGRLLVYGHCVGTASALADALELEREGAELVGVVLGASFPTAELPGRLSGWLQRRFPSDRWTSDRAYKAGLQALGGQLEEDDETVMRSVRHDVRQAIGWFSARYAAEDSQRLHAPLLCVVGEGDRTTELFTERYLEWGAFAERVELATIPEAGHYFAKNQASELAELIDGRLDSWLGKDTDSAAEPTPSVGRDGTPSLPSSGAVSAGRSARRELRQFYALASSQAISLVGAALTTFGLGVWVYQRTHDVGAFAVITMLALLPAVFAAPIGGAVADRYDRRRVLLACHAVYGVCLLGLCLLALIGRLGMPEVAGFVTVTSTTQAFHRPAYLASVAQIVPKPYLAQANGMVQLGTAISTLMAPVLGGALITLAGLVGMLCFDLAALLTGATMVFFIQFPDRLFRKRRESFRSAVLGGWRFIIRRRPLVVMVLFFLVVNYLTATTTVLTGPLVLSTSTPAVLGLVLAAGGLGAAVGALVMVRWGGSRRRADGMIALTVGMGLADVVIGLRPSPLLMGIGLFLWWFCTALVNAHWLSIIQMKVGLELQGRVLATNQMLAVAMMPLGFLLVPVLTGSVFDPMLAPGAPLAGVLGQVFGTGPGRGMGLLLVVGGLLLAVWGVLGLRYRPLRFMEDRLPDVRIGSLVSSDLDVLQAEVDEDFSRPDGESGQGRLGRVGAGSASR